jgi:hypothetical protein
MAVAIIGSVAFDPADATPSPGSAPAGSDRLAVYVLGNKVGRPSAVSYGGQSLTRLAGTAAVENAIHFWYLTESQIASLSGTTLSVTDGDTDFRASGWIWLSGVDQTTPFEQTAEASNVSASTTTLFTVTPGAGQMGLAATGWDDYGQPPSTTSGNWTEQGAPDNDFVLGLWTCTTAAASSLAKADTYGGGQFGGWSVTVVRASGGGGLSIVGGPGILRVSGAGSTLTLGTNLAITGGPGVLRVRGGGSTLTLGTTLSIVGGPGVLRVRGAGSTLTLGTTLAIAGGPGVIRIAGMGAVLAPTLSIVGGPGILRVRGAGSTLTVQPDLTLQAGPGVLRVAGMGALVGADLAIISGPGVLRVAGVGAVLTLATGQALDWATAIGGDVTITTIDTSTGRVSTITSRGGRIR